VAQLPCESRVQLGDLEQPAVRGLDDPVELRVLGVLLEAALEGERHALACHEARVGQVEDVLVDGPSKKDPTVLAGRTRQNKLVHFAGDPSEVRVGCRADVRIAGAAPHWLRGELVDVTVAARPARVRIPVAVV
jgi:hypothetical protein